MVSFEQCGHLSGLYELINCVSPVSVNLGGVPRSGHYSAGVKIPAWGFVAPLHPKVFSYGICA